MFVERQGIVVWFKHMKHLRKLRRYGHVIFASKRLKYAIIYMNRDEVEDKIEMIQNLHFVKKVERSYKPDVDLVYEKDPKAKEKADVEHLYHSG
ncbi:YlbG family protein [Halalkalibacillus halophilus]|uniref:YlbG family protein n=1 Tax=Halalkalibacillus halophilus TaxID=392827 RepID=UPI0004001401|nr:YlbG family protein [Halalkalibacillus halophilus]